MSRWLVFVLAQETLDEDGQDDDEQEEQEPTEESLGQEVQATRSSG